MKGKLLPPVLTIVLALLTAGASRGSDWLSTPQPTGPGEVMVLPEIPPLCQECGKNCGDIFDDKGLPVHCGDCTLPDTCKGSGIDNVCGCTPKTCAGRCGDFDPGCRREKRDCGPCTLPNTCGGGGTANVCGCTPRTCAGLNCGSIDPGCGLPPVSCGQCNSATDLCKNNVCCTPRTCAGLNCDSIDPGCGLPRLSCGECTGTNDTCGGGGTPGVCGCTPRSCGLQECGSIDPGCGLEAFSCGFCRDGQDCIAGHCEAIPPDTCKGGEPRCCGGECPPCGICPFMAPQALSFCAAKGKSCGLIDDGRGGQVDCGTCKGKDTCGGGGVPNVCGRPRKKQASGSGEIYRTTVGDSFEVRRMP